MGGEYNIDSSHLRLCLLLGLELSKDHEIGCQEVASKSQVLNTSEAVPVGMDSQASTRSLAQSL